MNTNLLIYCILRCSLIEQNKTHNCNEKEKRGRKQEVKIISEIYAIYGGIFS